jgi:hypothetical protein
MTSETAPEMTAEERDKRLQKAYTAATQALREIHRDEFNDLYSVHAEKHGVEWKPRLSAEQKAEQEFDRLLRDFPHLVDRIAPA